jgi:ABC-2 type transport system permease protein
MREFRTLLFLDWFRVIFEKMGFDYPALRRILQVKFTMDQRRVPAVIQQQGKKGKESKNENRFIKSLWIYALFGLFIIPFVLMGENYIFQMSIAFAVIMFIVMTSMISDFSVVILDIRDNTILFTKPVEKKTISLAKTIHVCVYLFFLTGAMTIIPLIVALINQGVWFFLLFLAGIVLTDILIVVFTALLYYLILKYFDGERLKDIINYVQIGLSIGLAVGYQVVARSFEFVDLQVTFTAQWWQVFFPPVWFGSLFEWSLNGGGNPLIILFSAMALLFPFAALGIYIKILPSFERNLQKLNSHGGKKGKKTNVIGKSLMRIMCYSKEERAFYQFAHYMMKNEREFKLKVYPGLGFAIILPFIFVFNHLMISSFEDLSSSMVYLSIYASLIVIPTVVMQLGYSGKYKGSWIYKVVPVERHAPIHKGTLKAFLAKLFIPLYMVMAVCFLFLFGVKVLPGLIIVLISAFIYTVICYKLLSGGLPFTESFDGVKQSDAWKVLPFYIIIGAFVGMHILSLKIDYGIYVYLVLLSITNFIVWKFSFKD